VTICHTTHHGLGLRERLQRTRMHKVWPNMIRSDLGHCQPKTVRRIPVWDATVIPVQSPLPESDHTVHGVGHVDAMFDDSTGTIKRKTKCHAKRVCRGRLGGQKKQSRLTRKHAATKRLHAKASISVFHCLQIRDRMYRSNSGHPPSGAGEGPFFTPPTKLNKMK
jgi:hypothetical protein